jgi:hypothetical protein
MIKVEVESRDLHQVGLDGVRGLPDESAGKVFLNIVFLARDKIEVRRQLDRESPADRKSAALAVDAHINCHKFRIEFVAQGRREDGKCSVASGSPIADVHERLALGLGCAVGYVNTHGAVALMNRPRPRCGIDEIQTVQRNCTIRTFANVVSYTLRTMDRPFVQNRLVVAEMKIVLRSYLLISERR